jgi:CheY-specific phosphatase CheX
VKLSMSQVDEVLRTVLGTTLHLDPQELTPVTDELEDAQMVRAQIQFMGLGRGQILLQIESGLAKEIAALMTQGDPLTTSVAQSQDAVGELVNIIAGNLRPLMENFRSMSLPYIGLEHLMNLPGENFPLELNYRLDGRAFALAIEIVSA